MTRLWFEKGDKIGFVEVKNVKVDSTVTFYTAAGYRLVMAWGLR